MRQIENKQWMGIDNIHSSIEMDAAHTDDSGTRKYLVNATNMDFTDTGDLRSRLGTQLKVAGAHAGGIALGKWLLCVYNGALRAYDTSNWQHVDLVSVGNRQLAWVDVGGVLYISDGRSKWKLTDTLTLSDWGSGRGDVSFDDARVQPFPPCTKLTYINGRMYGAVDNFVIFSEPYRFDIWDPSKNFYPMGAKVEMLHANLEVLVVSAEQTWIVTQPGTDNATLESALPFPSPACVPAIDPESKTAFWMTERGWVSLGESDKMLKTLSFSTIATRRHESAVLGVVKRPGVTAVVAVSTPDAAYPSTNPLMSDDFVKSEQNRQEV